MSTDCKRVIRQLLPKTGRLLREMIAVPSPSGGEGKLAAFCVEWFAAAGFCVEKFPLREALKKDPDYCAVLPGLRYKGRHNLVIRLPGSGGGRSLLLNTHLDTVPPAVAQARRGAQGVVFGRGACDAKGQIATLYLLLRALRASGHKLKGDVIVHLVVEEEVGGNGTLAMVQQPWRAAGVIVMEPTNLKILTAARGAVWFRIDCRGRAGHSGHPSGTESALKKAVAAMAALERYHFQLLEKSRGRPPFDRFENPMPLTFGRLNSGTWPATVPDRAVLEGVLGFLPNRTSRRIMADVKALLRKALPGCRVEFPFRRDCSILNPGHILVQTLASACAQARVPSRLSALPACCDAVLYSERLGLPAVIFGPGWLDKAHAADEQIRLDEIGRAAEILARFVEAWCN